MATVVSKVCSIRERMLRQHTDLSLRAIGARLDAMDQALVMRTAELERRLEGLNELRSDVTKDRDLLVRKDMFGQTVGNLEQFKSAYTMAHQDVLNRLTMIESSYKTWILAIGGAFAILQLVLYFWK